MRAIIKFCIPVLLGIFFGLNVAHAQSLKISEKTKFYKINGETASDFAQSMDKKGPYIRRLRTRAWATAKYEMTYSVVHKKRKNSCASKGADVTMLITYLLPKLANTRTVTKRQRRKWRRMITLLTKHERTHGLYYRQLAKKVRRSLRRLRPESSCRLLDKKAKTVVKQLMAEDRVRNDRFEERDRRNYRRMERIYRAS